MVQKYLEKEFNYQYINKDIREGIDAAITSEGKIMQFLFEFFIKVQKDFFDNVNYLHIERRKQNKELWQ